MREGFSQLKPDRIVSGEMPAQGNYPFVFLLSWFDRLTTNGDRLTTNGDRLTTNGGKLTIGGDSFATVG